LIPPKNFAVWLGVEESVTFRPKPKPPAVVGVPAIAPVAEVNVRPGGKPPEATVHVNGAVPPETDAIALYATPTTPSGSDVIEKESCGFTTSANDALPVRDGVEESVTCIVKSEVPLELGTPEITPVFALRLKPVGSAPVFTDHE